MATIAMNPSLKLVDQPFLKKVNRDALHLSMELSNEYLACALVDKQQNDYGAFEVYPFTEAVNIPSALPEIRQILKATDLVKLRPDSVSLAINHQYSTIIPNSVFNESELNRYLELNFDLDNDDLILYDDLANIKAKNVFTFPRKVKTFFRETMPKTTFHHYSTSLIEPFYLEHKNRDEHIVIVHVQKTSFQLIIFKNKSLYLYNSFRYHNEDDFIYFIMFAFEQLKLDAEKDEVRLTGNISRDTALYGKLATYVKHISFESYHPPFRSIKADKTAGERFFSLFNQYLCVS